MTKQTIAIWTRTQDFTNPVAIECKKTWEKLAREMLADGRTTGFAGVEVAPHHWARDFRDQEAADEWSNMLRSLAAKFDIPFVDVIDVEYDPSIFVGQDRSKGINRFNEDGSRKV